MLNKIKKYLELLFIASDTDFQKNRNFDNIENLNHLVTYVIESEHFQNNFNYLNDEILKKIYKFDELKFDLSKNFSFNYQNSKKIYNFIITAKFSEKSLKKDLQQFLHLIKFFPYYFNYNNKNYYLNSLAIVIYILNNKKVKLNLANRMCRNKVIQWFYEKKFYSKELEKIKKKLSENIKFLTRKNSLFKLFNLYFFLIIFSEKTNSQILGRLFSNKENKINELLIDLLENIVTRKYTNYQKNLTLNKISNKSILTLFLNTIKNLPHVKHLNYGEDFSNVYLNKITSTHLEFWSKTWGWEQQLLFTNTIKKLISKKNMDNSNYLLTPVQSNNYKFLNDFASKPLSTNIINIIGFHEDDRAIGFDCDCFVKTVRNLGFKVNLINLYLEKYDDDNNDRLFPGYLNLFVLPLSQYALFISKYGYKFFKNRLNILCCQTELDNLSKHHLCLNNKYINEIWAISNFSAKGLKKIFKDKTIKIIPLLTEPVVNKKKNKSFFGIKKNDFVFLTSFDSRSSFLRKNPLSVVFAFKKAFDKNKFKNAKLIINARYADIEILSSIKKLINNDNRIKLYNNQFNRDELYSLIKSSDCIVSLHRTEGFGRNIADALYFNKKVIVSNYSGSKEFTLRKYCNLVHGKIIRIKPYEYHSITSSEIFNWFDPDIEHAAQLMRKVFFDKKRINVSHEFIKKKYGEKSFSRFLLKRIKFLCKDKLKFNLKKNDTKIYLPNDFDPKKHLTLNPDVAAAGVDPSQHYIDHGSKEGRKYLPNDFDPKKYLTFNPDVSAAGVDPGQHYIDHGSQERRRYK